MKRKIFSVITVLTIAVTMLSGCGSGTTAKSNAASPPATTTPADTAQSTKANSAADGVIKDKSSDAGEGVGQAVPPTYDEINYLLSLNTKNWPDLSEAKQDEAINLIVRWWESVDGYVDPDLDLLKQDLNHQMETYARNMTDIGVFATACDIRNLDGGKYTGLANKMSDAGEGIGKVVPPTNEEISYVLSLNTKSWLALNDAKQDEAISLIVRWWESVDGYVDPDLDLLKQDLNHQMETYSRNNTDIGLFATACDIRNIDPGKYVKR